MLLRRPLLLTEAQPAERPNVAAASRRLPAVVQKHATRIAGLPKWKKTPQNVEPYEIPKKIPGQHLRINVGRNFPKVIRTTASPNKDRNRHKRELGHMGRVMQFLHQAGKAMGGKRDEAAHAHGIFSMDFGPNPNASRAYAKHIARELPAGHAGIADSVRYEKDVDSHRLEVTHDVLHRAIHASPHFESVRTPLLFQLFAA